MKIIAALLALMLSGCAGIASYAIKPFYDPTLGKMVCCEVLIMNGKDIGAITVDAVKTGDDYTIHLQETGVGATAPVGAQSAAISNVAKAVSDTAISATKFIK